MLPAIPQAMMEIGSAFVADAESFEVMEPGEVSWACGGVCPVCPDRRYGIQQRGQLGAIPIDDHVVLGAGTASVDRRGASLLPLSPRPPAATRHAGLTPKPRLWPR
jgi:hypothetical protein